MSGALVAIGNFDGLHLGHQTLITQASDEASARGLFPVVLTFDPHPAKVLGRTPPPVLTCLTRKRQLLGELAPRVRLHVLEFTREIAAMTPEAFVRVVLHETLGAKHVLVGENFRFGKGRAGDLARLQTIGSSLGMTADSHAIVFRDGSAISSTRIRQELLNGNIQRATELLGRPHSVEGVVVHGRGEGRTLGFPTCNMGEVTEMLPKHGIYAVLLDRCVEGRWIAWARGVANLGVRPTLGHDSREPLLEAHAFDQSGSFYGERLRVHFGAYLREEKRFDSVDELRREIERDASRARAELENRLPPPDRGWA